MKHSLAIFLLCVLSILSCKEKGEKQTVSRTTGEVTMLVDESFNKIIDDQIEVFKSDYPDANFNIISSNESKMLPTFLNDSVRVMITSRMLTPEEQQVYTKREIPLWTTRFAIDGIALITNATSADTTITVDEVIAMMKGQSASGKSLVFDNAYSSTIRYFKDLAKIKQLPAKGVYTLSTNNDVITYIEKNKDFIGVVGVNWLIQNGADRGTITEKVKLMGVKNHKGKKGDNAYYKPTQNHLISGTYPFLRNIYIINAEGKDGLGTGFANWLVSQRGQLIVLKSGLGPHELKSRDFNLKN